MGIAPVGRKLNLVDRLKRGVGMYGIRRGLFAALFNSGSIWEDVSNYWEDTTFTWN